MISTISIAIVAFVSTNIDDIFLLIGFYSDKSFTASRVVLGQYLGIASLIIISAVCAFVSLSVAPAYVGTLGILPILIGAKKLWEASRAETAQDDVRIISRAGIFSVASVTIANGADNIGIYTPLFASLSLIDFSLTIAVFVLMTGLWCIIGYWFVNHKRFGSRIRYWGHRVLPFVLIVLGFYILWHSGSLALLAQLQSMI